MRFSRCIVKTFEIQLCSQRRGRKGGELSVLVRQVTAEMSSLRRWHFPSQVMAVPLHHRPLRENLWLSNIPVGSIINTSSWGLWLQLGIELGHISLRNGQKWLLLRFMRHLPSLVCIDGCGGGVQISISQGCKCGDCWAFFRFLLKSISTVRKDICHRLWTACSS